MVVVTPDEDGAFADIAERLASRRGENLVTWEQCTFDDSVYFVCPPAELTERRLLRLQKRLSRSGPTDAPFGVITGRSPKAAAALALEREPVTDSGKHVLLLRKVDERIYSPDEQATVVTRGEATVERLSNALNGDVSSLSSMMDGRSIHGNLDDGYICGIPTTEELTFEGYQPSCLESFQDDGRCPQRENILHADELRIPHVFLNSCSSLVPSNSSTGLPVHVGMSFLSSATSLIAGYRPRGGSPEEVALHHALLRDGYDAAERCYLLNRMARVSGNEVYPYVVFGNPNARIATELRSEYDVEVDDRRNHVDLTASGVDDHVLDVTLPADELDGREPLRLRVLSQPHREWPLLYSTFEHHDSIRLLVYSWGKIRADEIRFRLENDGHGLEPLRRSLANFDSLEQLDVTESKARGQRENLRRFLWGAAEMLETSRCRATVVPKLENRIEEMDNQLTSLEDRIVQNLSNRGLGFLTSDYNDRVVARELTVADESCSYCGRPVFCRRVEDIEARVDRILGFCPRCVNVFDVPTEYLDDKPRLVGDFQGSETDEIEFTFRVTNPTSNRARVVWYPWLWSQDASYRGSPVFTPRMERAILAPGETQERQFSADISELSSQTYSVYGYNLINLRLSLVCARLVV